VTILEATTKLLEFFVKNDAFELGRDFKKIVLISDSDEYQASVLAALDELVKQGFIIKKDFNGTDWWILVSPLALNQQNITVPLSLSVEIGEFLNLVFPETPVNPLQLNSNDIFLILSIAKKSLTFSQK
jgi:hypothetical protein